MQNFLKAVLAISILAAAALALLVAWWIALLIVSVALVYAGVRRMLRGRKTAPVTREPANIIDGEFHVEHGPEPATRHRIVDSDAERPKG